MRVAWLALRSEGLVCNHVVGLWVLGDAAFEEMAWDPRLYTSTRVLKSSFAVLEVARRFIGLLFRAGD